MLTVIYNCSYNIISSTATYTLYAVYYENALILLNYYKNKYFKLSIYMDKIFLRIMYYGYSLYRYSLYMVHARIVAVDGLVPTQELD